MCRVRLSVLFVFLILEHRRREVLHFNVTDHPAWVAQQSVLFLRRVRANFGFALGVFQISELRGHSARNCGGLTARLKAGEVGTIAPRQWSAEPFPSGESGIMHNVDQPLVVGITLFVAGKIAEISAGGKYRVYTRNCRDLASLGSAANSLDHLDQNHILVNRIPIPARNSTPEIGGEGRTAALAAFANRREIGPIPCCGTFLDRSYRWNHDNEGS